MEKDADVVARLGGQRREENWRFRTFLKASRVRSARVDRLSAELAREAEAAIDCRDCGACCRENCIPVHDEEVDRLARRAGWAVDAFRDRYMTTDDDGEPALDARPCPFLDANTCTVYADRPEACRGYPYVGGSVASDMVGIIERAEVCPIVFAMLEGLKDRLGFRRWV